MNPQEAQQPNTPMTPDEAKASLGIATALQQHLMPQGNGSQTQGNDLGQAQQPEMGSDPSQELQGLKDEIMQELQTIKEDVKMVAQGDGKDERNQIAELKKQIEDVLNAD